MKIEFDATQNQALRLLESVTEALQQSSRQRGGLLAGLRRRKPPVSVNGVYLWGGVGRGKTMIMDYYFDCLKSSSKQRLHFHRFMQQVHELRARFRQEPDPLRRVADHIADESALLCLDEMHINDIADAMIMKRLLECLFDRGVQLVTTSNVPPDGLYANGLQRRRFLPAIDLMQQRLTVFNLDQGVDYRLRMLAEHATYIVPPDETAHELLRATFDSSRGLEQAILRPLLINRREVDFVKRVNGVLWCEFAHLCEAALGTADYIELATLFHTVLLESVPLLDATQDDAARRLVWLIDEFYDRKVKMIISAAAPPDTLYTGKRLAFEFERTASRLHEMQTRSYLSQAHIP